MTSLFDPIAYEKDGFVLVPGLFTRKELAPLIDHLRTNGISENTFGVSDQSGEVAELMVWSQCGDDFIGIVPRLKRMIDIASAAIGTAVYHWHSKITLKEPGQKGSWDWHQDYGHWYSEGCLAPDMMSIGVALDPMRSDNGPLKLIRASHRLGRIDHIPLGASNGADPDHVNRALEKLELVECHLKTGDAVVFHSNTLHASSPNESDRSRSFFLSSYNSVSNIPWNPKVAGHACVDLEVVNDTALVDSQWREIVQSSGTIQPSERLYGYSER